MKYKVDMQLDDTVFVQFLRQEAEIVWSAIKYYLKQDDPQEYEIEDYEANYNLLGAMYLVEEYFSHDPQIRRKYPRDMEAPIEEWMAWDD